MTGIHKRKYPRKKDHLGDRLSCPSIPTYNPRQKSLARLDQITETCVDMLFWKQ